MDINNLNQLSADQLRAMLLKQIEVSSTLEQTVSKLTTSNTTLTKEAVYKDAKIEKLSFENAILKRMKFSHKSEALSQFQRDLLGEQIQEDAAAVEVELEQLRRQHNQPSEPQKQKPSRQALPDNLLRIEIKHEPDNRNCQCGCELKRIGEDVSEKLDYDPGTFKVERHVRGKWACNSCESIKQAPMPAQIIDKGIPTAGLLAHVIVSKHGDHLPLHRQQQIFERAGVTLPTSTLSDWVGRCGVELEPLVQALRSQLHTEPVLHGDETPVSMLKPGNKKTHKAYVWAYTSTPYSVIKAVVYDFAPGRSGEHARAFLEGWQGKLVCDDYSGYKESFAKHGVTEIGCMAHARRKFFELHAANGSENAQYALDQIKLLYDVERDAKDLTTDQRRELRQQRSKPLLDDYHKWLIAKRQEARDGSGLAKAIDYSVKRWAALTEYCDDGAVPIDNNWVENQMRPWALGRKNWLFAGSLRSGQRAANLMSLIQSAKLNGLDPQAYLKDVLTRLPTQKNSKLDELLPHNWQPRQ